jgi:hypothetical protein
MRLEAIKDCINAVPEEEKKVEAFKRLREDTAACYI